MNFDLRSNNKTESCLAIAFRNSHNKIQDDLSETVLTRLQTNTEKAKHNLLSICNYGSIQRNTILYSVGDPHNFATFYMQLS